MRRLSAFLEKHLGPRPPLWMRLFTVFVLVGIAVAMQRMGYHVRDFIVVAACFIPVIILGRLLYNRRQSH